MDSPVSYKDSEKGQVEVREEHVDHDEAFPDGGLQGWLCVAGSWLAIFATFGYSGAFGVFQAYYQLEKFPTYSASDISWIGALQYSLQFSLGAVAGPLYDKGYFYSVVGVGAVLNIFGIFMTSLCNTYWQAMLAQGVAVGLGTGLVFLPAVSVPSQYFVKRRALAIGVAVTGSPVGGICFPIMLNNLIDSHGFAKGVQYSGYLVLGALVVAACLLRPRYPPAEQSAPPKATPSPLELCRSKAYSALLVGLFVSCWGLIFPLFYLQVFGEVHGISDHLVFYSLSILNAACVFGTLANFLADTFGPINLMTLVTAGAGCVAFGMFGAGTPGGLVIVSTLYGFFVGAWISLLSPVLIASARAPSEIGARVGFGFLITSVAALTGTPITGALLTSYDFGAPIIWSGACILVGAAFFGLAAVWQGKDEGTWRV